MHMKSRFVLAGFIGLFAIILNSCATSKNTNTTPTTGFMWVTTQGDQKVTSYNINLTTGAASQVGSSVATGLGPIAIAITPAGDALFVANRDDNTISSYSLNSDGSLTVQGTPVKAGE